MSPDVKIVYRAMVSNPNHIDLQTLPRLYGDWYTFRASDGAIRWLAILVPVKSGNR